MGLWEVLGALPRIARRFRQLRADLQTRSCDAVLTVDSPELTLRLGAVAKGLGRPVVHWVAPQVWAWRPGRVRRLSASVDTVLCLLPFEQTRLAPHVRAVFTGHPAATIRPGARVRPGTPTFALLPGSRASELRRHWPVLREVARHLRRRHPSAGFVVPRAPTVPHEALGGLDAVLVDSVADTAGADAAVTASGTATLELAVLGVPMVVIYRVHPITYALARRLVSVPHVALPNLLAGRSVVPEYLQTLSPAAIARAVDAVRGQRQLPPDVIGALAGARAVRRAADEVAAVLFGQPSSR